MPRPATGSIRERRGRNGTTYAIRFRAYGRPEHITLGSIAEGWNRERAEQEFANVVADVRRGIWQPPAPDHGVELRPQPTFHEFASDWIAGLEPELAERTRVDYRWRITSHLLPFFQRHRLNQITVEEVDRYRTHKVREREAIRRELDDGAKVSDTGRPMSNGSINKTIRLLATILEQAVEYGHIDRNPAQGRKRLLRESKPSRSYLQPDQVAALLTAAGDLDAEARRRDTGRRRPLLATLTLAGLRISEALDLQWRHVNLAGRKLRVVDAKTDAGVREVDLSPTLQETLSEYRTRTSYADPGDLVFPTAAGRRDNPSNVRNRLLASVVERTNMKLVDQGAEPIGRVTPHSLRRTFASLLLATGADVPYVMAQLGHTNPTMTLGVYAKVIDSQTDHGAALDGLVGAAECGVATTMETLTL
jgi:integrase